MATIDVPPRDGVSNRNRALFDAILAASRTT
jgi:hypothetical protein